MTPSALTRVTLAVDCMGGDHGPSVTLPACRAFLEAHPEAHLILVGKPDALASAAGWPRCSVVAASEVVEMDDPVEVALRRKKDSSLRVAVSQVKAGEDGLIAVAPELLRKISLPKFVTVLVAWLIVSSPNRE